MTSFGRLRFNGRRRLLATAAAFGLAAGAGFGLSAGADADDTLTIGGAYCLTGLQATFDQPSLDGALVAVEQINENGGILGRQVKLINIDGKSDPVIVGTAAAQVIDQGAEVVLAPCDFDFGAPASRAAQENGLVGLSSCASSPLYNSFALGDKQFTLSMWNTTMGAAAAEFTLEKGWKNVWVVTDTFIDYTTSLSEYYIEHMNANGGTVLSEDKYTQGDQDFSAQLARLKASPTTPDAIFISSYMPDLGTIIRTIREAGIDAPIVGGDSYDDPNLFAALGEKFGSEVYFTTHTFLDPSASEAMGDFLARFEALHGRAADTGIVAAGYDTVMALAQAIEAAGTTEGAALAQQMEQMQFTLLTGSLDWSDAASGHEPDKEVALVALDKGVPQFLGWTRPTNPPKP